LIIVAALVLGMIERGIRVLQQAFHIGAIVGKQGDPDAILSTVTN
jgi:hypothetical protein